MNGEYDPKMKKEVEKIMFNTEKVHSLTCMEKNQVN